MEKDLISKIEKSDLEGKEKIVSPVKLVADKTEKKTGGKTEPPQLPWQ